MAKTKLIRTVVNCETGLVSEREFTAEEYAQKEIDSQKQLAAQFEAEAKAEAKLAAQAKLAALGLTVEDLQALGL
jgi:hypothetical protein